MLYHLAIDIGASGGRHILGCFNNGLLTTEEIYRFENGFKELGGSLVWDLEELNAQIINGIARCKDVGAIPKTIAIDTWGVDYVLLDAERKEILPAFAYRDSATTAIQDDVENIVSKDELYSITGIQHQNFNSIYRLYCDKVAGRLNEAEYMLMIPEYLSFKLTGKIAREYTNATTTGLINAKTCNWDFDLLDRLGYPRKLFGEIKKPPYSLGGFGEDIKKLVGFDAEVLLCPSHDTASAVMACPMFSSSAYISSGTWSLVGTENTSPVLSNEARTANLTNEGGVFETYRFLKNIMGMWLFQEIRRSIGKRLSYDEMMHLAEASDYDKTFDPNDGSLVAPDDMIVAIKALLGDSDLELGAVLSSVYHSLSKSYASAISRIENITGRLLQTVHIIGGGSKDAYLNKLTAKYTGKTVYAGPVEATAIGNLMCQAMHCDDSLTLAKVRECIRASFNVYKIEGE